MLLYDCRRSGENLLREFGLLWVYGEYCSSNEWNLERLLNNAVDAISFRGLCSWYNIQL